VETAEAGTTEARPDRYFDNMSEDEESTNAPIDETTKAGVPPDIIKTASSVVWTSLGPILRRVPGPTTVWALGTTRLELHGARRLGAQGNQRASTRLGN
jgi:hypothetical protein